MIRAVGLLARLYRWSLSLLPPGTLRRDRDEMAEILQRLLQDEATSAARGRVAFRAFRRLPGAVWGEWRDALRGGPARGPDSMNGRRWGMGEWLRRCRLAVRSLGRSPAFTWSSVLLVGLGVGAVTTVFTVVDHVLLRPLPYPAQDRLVYMTNGSHPGPVLRELDGLETVESWTAVWDQDSNLEQEGGTPVRLRQADVTPSFFTLFGARPAVGRVLVEADGDDHGLGVLTHDAWVSIWGADPDVVGRSIRLDGEPVEVVGVLDPGFVPPESLVGRRIHVLRLVDWSDPVLDSPNVHRHAVVARLASGVSLEAANLELEGLAERMDAAHPDMLRTREGELARFPFQPLGDYTVAEASRGLALVLAAVALLLLVACANVAHLFLARGLGRRREMAVRRAMGARLGALLAELSLESLLVGLGGALLGLGLAQGALHGFGPWIETALPRGSHVTLDLRILAFAALLSVTTALVFGLAPALRTLTLDVSEALRGSGRGITQNRAIRLFRNGLVAGEVALSLVLVALSGVLLRSFLQMRAQDPGVRIASTWVIPVDFPTDPRDGEYARVMGSIRHALLEVPGVEGVTFGMEAPFEWVGGSSCCWRTSLRIQGGSESLPPVRVHAMEASFLETYGIELVAGRPWPRAEIPSSPVPVLVAESLALELFGSAPAALGREAVMGSADGLRVRVAGVAGDTRYYGLDQGVDPAIYVPVEAIPFSLDIGTFGIHAPAPGPDFPRRLREAVWSVEPTLPLPTVVPLETWITASSSSRRFAALLLLAFGGVALLLAAGGLYGTLLYAVHQERRELGIRIALGAGERRIQGRVVRRGVGLALIGAVAGSTGALALGRLLESLVFGVAPQDPVSLAVAVAVLLATAAVASWLPARRASRTDPLETLAAE